MLPVPKLNATALVKLRMCVKGLNTVLQLALDLWV
jgi:hypothetical protein